MQRWMIPLTLILLLIAACGDPAGRPTATRSSQSGLPEDPDELLEQVQRAIDRDGQVFHTVITSTSTAGEAFPEETGRTRGLWTEEIWVAPNENAVRRLFRKDPAHPSEELADESLTLLVDGTFYVEDDDETEAYDWQPFCPPGSPPQLVAFMLDMTCRSFGPSPDMDLPLVTRVEPDASFDGQPVITIVYEKEIQPEGQPSPTPFSPPPPTPVPNINPQRMEARLYLDPGTLFPLAWETRMWDHAGRLMVTGLASFGNEFLPRDALESGFFDPEAFGYVARDLLAPLDDPALDVTIYWVGETFEPGGDLPSMEINDVLGLRPPGGGPGDQVMIGYGPVDTFSPAFGFYLQMWTPDDWESKGSRIGAELWQNLCVETEEFSVEGGKATIYQTYEPNLDGTMPDASGDCPGRDHDRFMAVIDYGDAIVTINAPLATMLSPRGNENAVDPYDSLEGMRAIIENLRRR